MYLKLKYKNNFKKKVIIKITGSKSLSNRLLIIKKLYNNVKLYNISNSNDTKIMIKALESNENKIDIKDAGTVMRFLTSYYSIQNKKKITLTGTKRMQKRPILYLVEALKSIGANIKYKKKFGYPPIVIKGKILKKNIIKIPSNISSQYITSLILIGPKLKKGLTIKLLNDKFSISYIYMTIKILKKLNFNIKVKKNYIYIKKYKTTKKKKIYNIESDWSSASYFYSILSILNEKKKLILKNFKKKSLQGDKIISCIYKKYFGIKTKFIKKDNIIILKKSYKKKPKYLKLNLKSTPDIAQTIIITCSCLKIKCLLKGLNTLKIKETDRLEALKKELKKIGVITKITNKSIEIKKFKKNKKDKIIIKTYKDHRMAMAFSTIAIIKKEILIENPYTINKSYPNFWKDLKKIGFISEIIN
ncbi:MAG: 3-phosphoshikimate 1-carboxyvinyltransferase [Candidatus Shikimatogenerans bostrichidophilus]|nr:MAG: 3-phosphoshikimate 1-carboxyvinyltransferase [Candidatus Shikimatogenerans bostrichidophilus]